MKDSGTLHDSDVLHWFAGLFLGEVTDDQFAAYQNGAAAPLLARISEVCDISDVSQQLELSLDRLAKNHRPERLLAADFAALFLLGEQSNAQPYAGLYRESGGSVFGEAHDRMLNRLQHLNLERAIPSNEPADHISFQLEYLSLLLSWPQSKSPPENWREFTQEELLPWIDRWSLAAINVPAKSRFYATLTQILCIYLNALVNRANVDLSG